jgi:hypothetical protein
VNVTSCEPFQPRYKTDIKSRYIASETLLRVTQLVLNGTKLRNRHGDNVAVLQPEWARRAQLCSSRPEQETASVARRATTGLMSVRTSP